MHTTSRLTVAAIALLAGMSVAMAAGNGMSKSTTSGSGTMSSSTSKSMTKDSLSLTAAQQKTAWKDISSQATKEKAPSGFTAKVGEKLPSDITTRPVPVSTANKVPALRSYQYALLNSNKLLIVNPTDKKVAQVITE
jgi:hypothetical protein